MQKIKNRILMAVALSLLTIVVITVFTIDGQTWQIIKELNSVYLLYIIATVFSIWLINGLKLKVLASGVGFKLSLLRAVEIALVGKFFSNITPSGIGGQPIKIMALIKSDISSGKASAIVIVELILRLLFFIGTLPIVFIKLQRVFRAYISTEILLVSLLFFILGLLIIIYLLLYQPRYLALSFFWVLNQKLIAKFISRKRRYTWKRSFVREIRIFYQTIWIYLKDGILQLIAGFILTVLMWSVQFIVIYLVIRGLNLDASLSYLYLLQLLLYTMVIFIPMPGGSGIEVIFASLLHQTLPISIIGVVVASWRFFTYYAYIIFGGLISFKVFHLNPDEIE